MPQEPHPPLRALFWECNLFLLELFKKASPEISGDAFFFNQITHVQAFTVTTNNKPPEVAGGLLLKL